jgi:hypothetical protein
MSGNLALSTLFPATRQLTLAGSPVFVGKLKLRQKATLQHWLDEQPEPNGRVLESLKTNGVTGWPIGVEHLPFLLDASYEARFEFLKIALQPFNPGLTGEEIERLAGESQDDSELVAIMLAAYGHEPQARPRPTDPKDEPADVGGQI